MQRRAVPLRLLFIDFKQFATPCSLRYHATYAMLARCRRRLSVCLSVCLYDISRCSTEKDKRRIIETMPTIAQFSYVKALGKTQTGLLPTEAPNAGRLV